MLGYLLGNASPYIPHRRKSISNSTPRIQALRSICVTSQDIMAKYSHATLVHPITYKMYNMFGINRENINKVLN